MTNWPKYGRIDGPIVMIGFGSIGQGTLPLLLRHFEFHRSQLTIISPDDSARIIADDHDVRFIAAEITRKNLRDVLSAHFDKPGGFLINLSVNVASTELIRYCREVDAFYVDTCIEPWPGAYTDPSLPMEPRTNYALRENALAVGCELGAGKTAVIAHGANPGLVSHFVKQALLNIATDLGHAISPPTTRLGWASLARDLGIKGIHIAERDTQVAATPKEPGEFVNTWSIDGFLSEGMQPAELGWGTFEGALPEDAVAHDTGCGAAIFLARPGAETRVRSWTPNAGPIQGYLITHNESISIADYFTLRDDGKVTYRPTCHYAYHPCDDAILSLHELQGNALEPQDTFRLINEEIIGGMDELGVLLYGHEKNAYWYGSQLTIEDTRALAPYQNATGLQVTAAVIAAMAWAMENPDAGVVEADQMDYARILEIAGPYIRPLVDAYTDWTPLEGRMSGLFPEDIDEANPWRFHNVIFR